MWVFIIKTMPKVFCCCPVQEDHLKGKTFPTGSSTISYLETRQHRKSLQLARNCYMARNLRKAVLFAYNLQVNETGSLRRLLDFRNHVENSKTWGIFSECFYCFRLPHLEKLELPQQRITTWFKGLPSRRFHLSSMASLHTGSIAMHPCRKR